MKLWGTRSTFHVTDEFHPQTLETDRDPRDLQEPAVRPLCFGFRTASPWFTGNPPLN